ncbi:S8 family serine peptidase [Bdellovibrio svalbardensis]|nr:S8 family serine peptidase [Bdellovibrio svalbardensis]
MKLTMFSVFLSVILSSAAFAEQRVIVVMKDAKSFHAANLAYKNKDLTLWKSVRMDEEALKGVEHSLENLKTFIVMAKDQAEIARLKANPAVAIVEEEVFHPLPQPMQGFLGRPMPSVTLPGAKTPWGIMAVKAPAAWDKSKSGEGARVLVLDTGIDKDHPAIKANFERGQDFTGRSTGSDFSDVVGHGTHVSGTVAGVLNEETGFTGVAPKAKLLMGRVCSNLGCSSSAIVQGINWGISQKVDVISMSLGGAWSTPAERDAVNKADGAGLSIVAASGNDGSGKVSFPAALSTVVAVGAVSEDLVRADFSQYGPELAVVAPGVEVLSSVPRGTGRDAETSIDTGASNDKVKSTSFQGAREVFTPETKELVAAGLGKPEDFKNIDVKGKYALVSRGEIFFADKAKNAAAAGALGIIIYNNAPGLIQGALTADGSTLPVVAFMIEQTVGQNVLSMLGAGKVVKATVRTIATDYTEFQGTSMATPHVAGVVALMKAANPRLKGAQVKAILKQSATPMAPNDKNQYGAGLVNAEAAVNAAMQAR